MIRKTERKLLFFISLLLLILLIFTTNFTNDDSDIMVSLSSKTYAAKSIICMDSATKEIYYEKNANSLMLPASVIKMLTLYTALMLYEMHDVITISDDDIKTYGSSIYLASGDIVTIELLLYGLILQSGNDAALTIARAYSGNTQDFIFYMNYFADKIGMKNTTIANPSGLDEETANYTTAYDLALLVSKGLENEYFRMIVSARSYQTYSLNERNFSFYNKHRLVNNIDYCIGGKTGYTKKAGRTLISCFTKNGIEIIIVTLDAYDDWNIHLNLAEDVYQTLF